MIAQGWATPANVVTVVRIAITPAVIALVIQGRHREAAIWFAVAAFTDFLDGWLARARHTVSTVGQYLDPIADKILLSGVFVALAIAHAVPVWFVVLVLGRDVALLVASVIAMRVSTYSDYTPTIWGKTSTMLQILAAVSVMASNAEGSGAWKSLAAATVWTSAAATFWSTVHYTWRGVMYFVRKRRH